MENIPNNNAEQPHRDEPIMNVPSESISQAPQAPKPRRASSRIIIILLVIAILLVLGVIAAKLTHWNPFVGNLPSDQVISKMLDSIPDVMSAHYDVGASFVSEQREQGAQSLDVALPEFAQQKEALKRDQQRLSARSSIIIALQNHEIKTKQYPISLASIFQGNSDTILDPSTHQQYGYRQEQGGKNYTLDIELETDAAARAYQKALEDAAKYSDTVVSPSKPTKLIQAHDETAPTYVSLSFSDVSPSPLGFNLDGLYQYLPVDIKANLAVAGQGNSDATKANDSSFNVAGTLALGSTTFAGGVDVLKKADTFYIRLNDAPSFGFFDLAAIKGKWVTVRPEDRVTGITGVLSSDSNISGKNGGAILIKQYQILFRALKEENLIQVSQEFPQAKTAQGSLYHYAIKLDRSKFADFYKRLTDETQKEFGDKAPLKFSQETLAYLQSEDFTKFYDVLDENTQLELWVDASSFAPRKISYTYRFVPPDSLTKLKGKQYKLNLVAGLSDINQPIAVEIPGGAISVDEAQVLLTGDSPEKIKYDRQVSNIRTIRNAIETYYGYTGHDPATLSELLKNISDVPAGNDKPSGFARYEIDIMKKNKDPFLSSLPKDVYTGNDYEYKSDGKTYTLTYQLKLPPKNENVIRDYEYDSIRSEYVEGQNTATEKTASVEAQAAKK